MKLRFEKPAIYLITKGESTNDNFPTARRQILEIIRFAVDEKVELIQIREKRLSGRLLFELTSEAAELTSKSETRLLINDRADIALAANADGVHLAANSITADVIRRTFPENFIIGVSTHFVGAAERAVAGGADFLVFGPVFQTPEKSEPAGIATLSAVCEKLKPFPVIALGGINASNCSLAIAAGASGIAAIRSLNDPESLRAISMGLKNEA